MSEAELLQACIHELDDVDDFLARRELASERAPVHFGMPGIASSLAARIARTSATAGTRSRSCGTSPQTPTASRPATSGARATAPTPARPASSPRPRSTPATSAAHGRTARHARTCRMGPWSRSPAARASPTRTRSGPRWTGRARSTATWCCCTAAARATRRSRRAGLGGGAGRRSGGVPPGLERARERRALPPQRAAAEPAAGRRHRLSRLGHHREPGRQGPAARHPGHADRRMRRRCPVRQGRSVASARDRPPFCSVSRDTHCGATLRACAARAPVAGRSPILPLRPQPLVLSAAARRPADGLSPPRFARRHQNLPALTRLVIARNVAKKRSLGSVLGESSIPLARPSSPSVPGSGP